jgi:hypothetical protein
VVNGVTIVRLDVPTQKRSGIETQPLRATSQVGETTGYGNVMDLQPLLDLRNREESARNEAMAAQSAANASREELTRMRLLYEDRQNVSQKAYQAAKANYDADRAKAEAATLNVRNVAGLAKQQFGQVLAGLVTDGTSAELARLLNREDVLARVALPPRTNAKAPVVIEVQAAGGERLGAYFVSPAAQADPALIGRSFIYRVPSALATGTPLVAYVPESKQAKQGVFVPASAVVWYAGQPWIYTRSSPTTFARKALGSPSEVDDGYFVRDAVTAGEYAVTRGAQLLLSEEQRPPPTGTGCKDPECD